VIDRTEHDVETEKKQRDTVDDDPHADHSLDPNEHYGQESEITPEPQLPEDADSEA
jgi:hypothetical protein